MYKWFIRPVLFRFDPEWVHGLVLNLLDWAGRSKIVLRLMRSAFCVKDPILGVEAGGVKFRSPVIMAAGFSKTGKGLRAILALGFSSVVLGSVGLSKWAGNKLPRIVRLVGLKALINRMGLPNGGMEELTKTVPWKRVSCPVGVSLIPTPGRADPIGEMLMVLRRIIDFADYVELNLSCPNTMDGRQFQDPVLLRTLLVGIEHSYACVSTSIRIPVWVKISPDLTDKETERLLDVCLEFQGLVRAVVVGNTSIEYVACGIPLKQACDIAQKIGGIGGLSGKPLFDKMLEKVKLVKSYVGDRLDVIACGGVFFAEDAWKCLCAGAKQVEILTGLVYEGPGLIRKINLELARSLRKGGYKSIEKIIGRGAGLD